MHNVVVLYKSSLIDSKTQAGNEAEGESHRERLSEKNSKEYAIVRPVDINETTEVGRNDQPRNAVTIPDYGQFIGRDADNIWGATRMDWLDATGTFANNQSALCIVNTLVSQ